MTMTHSALPGMRRVAAALVLAATLAGCGAHVSQADRAEFHSMSSNPPMYKFAQYAIEADAAVVRIAPLPDADQDEISTTVCGTRTSVQTIKFYPAGTTALESTALDPSAVVDCVKRRAIAPTKSKS